VKATALAAITAIVVTLAAAQLAASQTTLSDPDHLLDYGQARALGLRTLPAPEERRLPACRPDPNWKGFATREEALRVAEAVATAEPTCVSDPRNALYSTREWPRKVPYQGGDGHYRWAGAQTVNRYEGGRITVEVGNPDVSHGGPPEFVAARVMAFTPINRWVEAGWAEDTAYGGDARYVYTAINSASGYFETVHSSYVLTDGSFYIFRVRDWGNDFGDAEIWWAGSWNFLDTNPDMLCRYSYGTPNCNIEEATEIYSTDFTWPTMNAPVNGSGVNYYDTMLRTDPSTWVFWNDSLYPSTEFGDPPYSACWAARDWDFRTPQGSC
jgi:hypothetical protein